MGGGGRDGSVSPPHRQRSDAAIGCCVGFLASKKVREGGARGLGELLGCRGCWKLRLTHFCLSPTPQADGRLAEDSDPVAASAWHSRLQKLVAALSDDFGAALPLVQVR